MPLSLKDNLKKAKYFPLPKSNSMSKLLMSCFCFCNFLTQSALFNGLQLELNAVKVTVKYIVAGLAYKLAVDPQGIIACLPMLSQLIVLHGSATTK